MDTFTDRSSAVVPNASAADAAARKCFLSTTEEYMHYLQRLTSIFAVLLIVLAMDVSSQSALAIGLMQVPGNGAAQPAKASMSGVHVDVVTDDAATPRELHAAEKLRAVIDSVSLRNAKPARILAATRGSKLFATFAGLPRFAMDETEAFRLMRRGNDLLVIGSGASGVLYGCIELGERIRAGKALPAQLDVEGKPALRIRATSLFWMKGGDYNSPVVPETFPWFFDRQLMTRYLDLLADNRLNTIVFWNGHPFPYFLPLERFPEARMLDPAALKRNMDYLKWFAKEADRRGIWTVFEFYNIHVSPAFAKAHAKEGVLLENPATTPLLADYTRTCIREFVSTYPSVALMITPGEALSVEPEKFVRDVIISAVKDTGKDPPLIVRQWGAEKDRFRDIVQPAYHNLFTEIKHNTEMIVSPWPDPRDKEWAAMGPQIINMHEMADVRPFRWGSPVFIQQMIANWKAIGAKGMHVFPMSGRWPEAMDRTPLQTIDRDGIWLEAFGRYGWNPDLPAHGEEAHWKAELSARFGSDAAGAAIYNFYVETGPILPGIQNTVNIFNMNLHPTPVGQEATLNGILHSERWEDGYRLARPLDALTLVRYEKEFGALDKEAERRPPLSVKEVLGKHEAAPEPVKLSQLFVEMAEDALNRLGAAKSAAPREADEYARFETDARCVLALARFYHAKIEAALDKGRYDRHGESADYDRMLRNLDESVSAYRELAEKASGAYVRATDLAQWWLRWRPVLDSFEAEKKFYHEQKEIAANGADVVYLGLDGPMDDATNAFHWLAEREIAARHWTSQSYHLEEDPFRHARLVVVYDMGQAIYRKYAAQLEAYVREGGKVLVWDATAQAIPTALLEGITFRTYAGYRAPMGLGFETGNKLVAGLAGSFVEAAPNAPLRADVAAISGEWKALAWAGMNPSAIAGPIEFEGTRATFGPRWTALADPALAPVLATRQLGRGKVVLAQLGDAHVEFLDPKDGEHQMPAYLQTVVGNVVRWAEEQSNENHEPSVSGGLE